MKDDKKKLIVVGALALVIVCVGVFQFAIGSRAPTPPPVTKKEEPKKAAPTPEEEAKKDEPKNPLFAMALPARDPFKSPVLKSDSPSVAPAPSSEAGKPPIARRVKPLPDVQISRIGDFGSGPLSGVGSGNVPVTVAKVPEPEFTYALSGVMLGARPLAVFTDSQGNQRIVPIGGSLDADSRVLKVEKDAVTIRFHGKTLRLSVEGNPNDK